MPRMGTVNYHVHRPERQAFHIDAGGVVGKLLSPELSATQVAVRDVRTGEAEVSFQNDGISFEILPSEVTSFKQNLDWKPIYETELRELLVSKIDAEEVVVFDHTVRVDDPTSVRKPARNVHSDYSPEGAHQRLIDILGEAKAREWSLGHYAFINVWRPIESPINSAPLGFVRPSSVLKDDWVLIDLIYPERKGHIMGLVANEQHEWIYKSLMTPDELVFFNIYDNQGRPSIGHSALDLLEDPSNSTIRKSIETRTLVRFGS